MNIIGTLVNVSTKLVIGRIAFLVTCNWNIDLKCPYLLKSRNFDHFLPGNCRDRIPAYCRSLNSHTRQFLRNSRRCLHRQRRPHETLNTFKEVVNQTAYQLNNHSQSFLCYRYIGSDDGSYSNHSDIH